MAQTPVTLRHEIQEQPAIMRRLLSGYEKRVRKLAMPPVSAKRFIALAEGSSKHALDIAAPFIESWTGKPLWVYDPEGLSEKLSIHRHYTPHQTNPDFGLLSDAYMIVVSQSGKTASVRRCLEDIHHAMRTPPPILSMTNNPDSPLAQEYPNHWNIEAGTEQSIAATKTLTATVLSLLLWGISVGTQNGNLTPTGADRILQEFEEMTTLIEALWEPSQEEKLVSFARKLMEVNHFVLLSKGPIMGILPEVGLKLTETSRNIVYSCNTESFKHGPKVMLAGVNGVHPNSIYFVPPDKETADALFHDIRSHFWKSPFEPDEELAFEDDRVFFVRFKNSPRVPDFIWDSLAISDNKILKLPKPKSLFDSLFLNLIAFQLISYHLAMFKGDGPNDPTLEKAVLQ